ncbi:FMN-binding protein [Streptomyces monashensis]|uniref:FMN-binding domain-containing protein n=1 Tax=Streptomyces monashensis TaxID=1678012 RepID=A0A1S2QKR5_9ACTN|nr:FMN-binding protein [Streptomyces monashensis]OIK06181.1 FMN-binding domain-containing protein [Streptomyces monashensis]
MKRAVPVLLLTVAGLVPVWRYQPSAGTADAARPASTPSAVPSSPSSASSPSSLRVVPGTAVDTVKGVFQVEVTFRGDRIAAVRMLQAPHHPQTRWAVPELVTETLKAQSAHIDSVSGATITSQGYKESLQAAIDAKAS